ncbi:unnamed protein product [Brassica oleracea var. botrytis]|uniref:(rape) hypothetical protein n=1 Tax=Brassica napus TaxID=3708 RepID=A0A816MAE9_BRANA|nr:unnamed protein product [Brassica napus]
MNYRLPKVAWGKTAYNILMRSVEVNTVIGLGEEYKHLVGATHSDDDDFHSVVKRSDWEQGFVDMFVATEDIGQQPKTKDKDAEHGENLNHSEDEEEKKDEGEKNDEEYQKDKEKRKDKDHSMSNSEKLDKLIQMVCDLDKRVVVIQNVLGVKFNYGSPNKDDCENGASYGDRRSAQDYENEEDTIDEEANSGVKKNAPDDGNEEDTIAEEANSGDGRSALDDEMKKRYHLREEDNILGENETTQKITQDEDTEKLESESCLKQTSQVTSPTSTFNTPNFDTRVTSPTPTFTSSKFDLFSQESHSGKGTNDVNEDVEPPLQKKFKADRDNVPLRRSERVQIPSIHTQPPFGVAETETDKQSDFFLNKTALVVGVKFLEEIDELYDEFLDDKKSFQFVTGFDKYNIEKNINFLYSAIAVEEKYWLGVVVNLEKRSIIAFNCAAMKYTDASLVPYVNAYTMALPFMIRNFFKDVSMDTRKFSIKIVSEGFPQVLKIENSEVYALKLIECHAMRIVDLTNLSEEKIAIIREKLAVDIFSELQ